MNCTLSDSVTIKNLPLFFLMPLNMHRHPVNCLWGFR